MNTSLVMEISPTRVTANSKSILLTLSLETAATHKGKRGTTAQGQLARQEVTLLAHQRGSAPANSKGTQRPISNSTLELLADSKQVCSGQLSYSLRPRTPHLLAHTAGTSSAA